MVERQVARWMGRMLDTIARADVAVLADVAGDHPLGQAGPSCIRMDMMVGTHARQARMLAAASSRSTRDDTADRAQLQREPPPADTVTTRRTLVTLDRSLVDIAWSVRDVGWEVYSPGVLHLQDLTPRHEPCEMTARHDRLVLGRETRTHARR